MSEPEILTERLLLNRLLLSDTEALFEYRSDAEVSRYQDWATHSLDETARSIDSHRSVAFDTPGTWFQLAMRLRESGLLVGDLGVHFPAEEPQQVEVGFTVAASHQRRGFASEAVTGLLDHLFGTLRKHRVFASVDPRNAASIALLERLGMRREAHFRESLWFKGEWVDDVVFAILESEWAPS
ncbi:MAG: GNAT family N-acetyltransferase [bacterium]|nr:GNAT family N-acetyltransferase [bacterium]